MSTKRNGRRVTGSLLAVGALLSSVAIALTTAAVPQQANAAGETIISTFYVPLFEDNARAALFAVNGATGSQLSSTTSITVAAAGTIIYYDQWEDGYEADPSTKTQASTLVFGDGNAANGDASTYCVPARCAGDVLPIGAVLRLNNSTTITPGAITVPRTTGTVVFDGRDKISSTGGLAVTHATWPTNIDALHSEMASAFDTSRWGVNFVVPVGTDTPAQGAGSQSFTYTGVEVMARKANTQVFIDGNHDGDYLDASDVNGTTIGEGQTVYVNGGVLAGATITASEAVQVFLMTGRIGSNYEDRSYQVFPTEGLVNDYIAPASTARASGSPSYATVLYLFNPKPTSIVVTVQTSSGSTNYTIPAGQTLNPAPVLPSGQAARVTSTSTFAALAGIGTAEVAANSLNYDWGYSLLPARLVLDSLSVGWAPGSQTLAFANYDPVWVTTLAPTTLFVDYDGDPATGNLVDPNGSRYDVSYTLATALTSQRITDPTDNDMTGAHVYTIDGVGIASAYGEDPATTTPVAQPGIDLGTTMFPACGAMCVHKSATIAIDVDGDGLIDPGDTLQWTVLAANTDYYPLVNPVLYDTLPAGLTYVPGSTVSIVNGGFATPVADDVVPPAATLFPYDGAGKSIAGTIPVDGSVTIRYQTQVDPAFAGTTAVCNRATVLSVRETIGTPANGTDTGCISVDGLRITKTSSANGNPVLPGQTLSYTLQVTNSSSSTLNNIAVTDPLPAGLTWGSTSVTLPARFVDTVADTFDASTNTWGGSTGTVAWSATAWTDSETANNGTGNGFIRKVTDGGDLSAVFRNSTTANTSLSRVAGDLSAYSSMTLTFDTRCNGMTSGTGVIIAEIRKDAVSGWSTLGTWGNTCATAAGYTTNTYPLTTAQFGAATELRFRVTSAFSSGGQANRFYIDDVQFTSGAGRAGAAPPNLYTFTDLQAGESATIVVTTTVNNPYTATDEATNIATVRSGNQVARASTVDCVRCFDFGDGPATTNGAGGLDPARARVVSTRAYIADTFQTPGYTGSTGTVPWGAASWTETDTGGAGPTAGLVQNVIDSSTRSIRVGSASTTTPLNTGISRVVGDLSSYNSVSLGFDYRCSTLGADDAIQLQIRPTAAAGWTTLQTFTNCNNATTYSGQDITLTAGQWGTATEVRLTVSNGFEAGEYFFFDDVQVRAVADSQPAGPRLGTLIDREVQGAGGAAPTTATPPAAPTGDDTTGVDDEDGVALPSVDSNTIQIPITVTDASGGVAYVNGWLDWSNDKVFQTGESIFDPARFVSATGGLTAVGGTGQVPAPGTYTVTVSVPELDNNGSGYQIGNTVYARFRVATLQAQVVSPTGASSDGEVEDYSATLNTLPVSVAYFGSTRTGGRVHVEWRTAQEVDNLGFNVYAEGADGRLHQLNRRLIVSKAPTSIDPQEYDLAATTRGSTLWLEDVALDGTVTRHGPYAVGKQYGTATPPQPVNWRQARAQVSTVVAANNRARRTEAKALSTARVEAPAAASGPVARLEVTASGVQQVTYAQLLAAGIDLAGVPASSLAVTDRNGPVAVDVVGGATFGPGSALRFVGEPLDTIYTATNVYRLVIDPSLVRPMPVASNEPGTATTEPTRTTQPPPPGRSRGTTKPPASTTAPPTTAPPAVVPTTGYTATAVNEANHAYSVTAPGDDPWYDRMGVAFAGTPTSASATVDVTDPVAGQAGTATVELWGITHESVPDEHHVLLTVNGVVVANARFDDTAALRLQGTVPANVLHAGANTLQVTLLADTGVPIDIIAIDSWAIAYQRSTVAVAGRLDATVSGQRLDVAGMPAGDVIAYRVAADGSVAKLPVTVDNGVVQVPATAQPQRYVLSAATAVRSPTVSPARTATDLLGGSADYLMVTNGALSPALQPLVAFHQSQGRTVKVVDVADVYEAYSGGVVDAHAIDAYLAAAVPALGAKWVLLVGADSVDYRDYDGDGSFSLLPSLYGATGFNVTYAPLDPAYADIDGDGQPDVALGRMPARTPAELTMMIAKTLTYANGAQRTAVLASDANDGLDYAALNDGVAAQLTGWAVQRADVERVGVDDARATLLAAIEGGSGLTWYLGHSGSQQWTELGLFDDATAAGLTNAGAPTVVAQFGCWNTYYVAQGYDTLAHVLMADTGGGAAAVMGASTLTSAGNDALLAGYLAQQLAGGTLTIGEAVLAAKQQLQAASAGSTADVLLGWTILGDPAIVAGGAA